MPVPTFLQLKDEYKRLWDSMIVRDTWSKLATKSAQSIISKKDKYLEVQSKTNVPWYWIGPVHQLEAGGSFLCHLHNGDSLQHKTRNVPSGRPATGSPPFTWMESAEDALKMKSLHEIKSWSIERMLFEWERYNGFGYRRFHSSTLSPYLWSGSQHYSKGKYVADGRWSASAVSGQIGACVLLKKLCELDPTIQLYGEDSGRFNSV